MSVMPAKNLLTREDLDALPDDGLRHELIDGALVMSPSPGVGHQDMSAALFEVLRAALPGTGLKVLYAPVDVVLGTNVVQPDLVVAAESDFTERGLFTPPLLVVEVRSPSTAWVDEGRKRTLYEEAGVAYYWLADPAAPSMTILELVDGHYAEAARATGDQSITVATPVALTLNPVHLARG